ncbi:zinc-binding dehydrogenase [Aeromicrobium sp. UC242_57]|uniref:zinc-binding dehydrogenase n=1 Tax=Aeromicrobium sp. UC242_57 TaxID=3374624 RepID=UPI00379039A4
MGQIARIKGARAVGIAGGPEKVAYLEEIGFDVALDHRSPTFAADLKAAAPDGIDVYFENVGGHVWDAVMPLLNDFARVPVCGLVAHYNDTELPPGPDRLSRLMSLILTRRLTVRGFIQNEFAKAHYKDFQRRPPAGSPRDRCSTRKTSSSASRTPRRRSSACCAAPTSAKLPGAGGRRSDALGRA